MRKALLLAAVAALVLGSTALAQDSVLFFDVRNDTVGGDQAIGFGPGNATYPYWNTTDAINGGHAGAGQTLYMSPARTLGHDLGTGWPNNDVDGNSATGKLWLYMDVNTDDSGGAGVISSIGLDFNVTAPAAPKNTIGSMTWAWDATAFAGANAGKSDGSGGPAGWTGVKGCIVPVSGASPIFDPTGGFVPSTTTHYKLGAFSMVGGARNCTWDAGGGFEAASTYEVRMATNGLLVTRAFPGAPSDAVELVSFGYAGSVPETAVNGSLSGQTSVLPDAKIVVVVKGDFNYDGRCNPTDQTAFNTQKAVPLTAASQHGVYLGDFNGDRRCNPTDQTQFNLHKAYPGCN